MKEFQRPIAKYKTAIARVFGEASADKTRLRLAGDDVAVMQMTGVVAEWGISDVAVSKMLDEIGDADLELYINSPGGDVFTGVAIANLLSQHSGKVTAVVNGLCASIATMFVNVADERIMRPNTRLMIHNAWSLMIGDRNDMLAMAEVLEGIDLDLRASYAKRGTASEAEFAEMMDKETWMNPEAAQQYGLIDVIQESDRGTDDGAAAARFDVSMYENAPADLLEQPRGLDLEAEKLKARAQARMALANI